MKRLLLALILAVVLSLTLATPAFAWGPPDPPDLPQPGEDGVDHAWNTLIWPACWGVGEGWRTSGAASESPASHGRFYGNIFGLFRLAALLGS